MHGHSGHHHHHHGYRLPQTQGPASHVKKDHTVANFFFACFAIYVVVRIAIYPPIHYFCTYIWR